MCISSVDSYKQGKRNPVTIYSYGKMAVEGRPTKQRAREVGSVGPPVLNKIIPNLCLREVKQFATVEPVSSGRT